jgi:hypothetical protein
MATWTIKTYCKKSCEQIEYFRQQDGDGTVVIRDGFRLCEYSIETNDDNFPEFEFTEVPGGDGKKDSLDLNCLYGNNIEGSELIEMFDGGCWGDIEIEGVNEEVEKLLREKIEEEGSYSIEDDGEWYLDETEVWVWGPLEVTNEETGETRIIIADEDGNVTDFKEE